MAGRQKPRPRAAPRGSTTNKANEVASSKKGEINATVAAVLYYSVYTLVFGKMALVLLGRAFPALGL
eukprot:160366-Prymnesium_polylepis.1